jgi:hypothetical protein
MLLIKMRVTEEAVGSTATIGNRRRHRNETTNRKGGSPGIFIWKDDLLERFDTALIAIVPARNTLTGIIVAISASIRDGLHLKKAIIRLNSDAVSF